MAIDIKQEQAEFDAWWEVHRLAGWRSTLLESEKDKPMPENWSSGHKRQTFTGWLAAKRHAAQVAEPKPDGRPGMPRVIRREALPYGDERVVTSYTLCTCEGKFAAPAAPSGASVEGDARDARNAQEVRYLLRNCMVVLERRGAKSLAAEVRAYLAAMSPNKEG